VGTSEGPPNGSPVAVRTSADGPVRAFAAAFFETGKLIEFELSPTNSWTERTVVETGVVSVTALDCTGDGRDELIAVPEEGGALWVFEREPLGSWRLHSQPVLPVAAELPVDIVAGRDTHEGNIVVVAAGSTLVSAKIGKGCRVDAIASHREPTAAMAITLGDVNRDGADEVVVVFEGELVVFPSVELASPIRTELSGWAIGVAVGDHDSDGTPEIVVSDSPEYRMLSVFRWTDGVLHRAATLPSVERAGIVRAADIDGDGAVELVVASSDEDGVGVIDCSETAPACRFYSTEVSSGTSLRVADVTGDGVADILAGGRLSGISVFEGANATLSSSVRSTYVGLRPGAIVSHDLTGDGRPEIIGSLVNEAAGFIASIDKKRSVSLQRFSVTDAPGPVVVLNGEKDPRAVLILDTVDDLATLVRVSQGAVATTRLEMPSAYDAVTADLDGDGLSEVLVSSPATAEVLVVGQRDAGFYVASRIPLPGVGRLAISDLDRDGAPDLVVSQYHRNSVIALMGVSVGGSSRSDVIASPVAGPLAVATCDLPGGPVVLIGSRLQQPALSVAVGGEGNWSQESAVALPAVVSDIAVVGQANDRCEIVAIGPGGLLARGVASREGLEVSYAEQRQFTGGDVASLVSNDFDGDTLNDVAVVDPRFGLLSVRYSGCDTL